MARIAVAAALLLGCGSPDVPSRSEGPRLTLTWARADYDLLSIVWTRPTGAFVPQKYDLEYAAVESDWHVLWHFPAEMTRTQIVLSLGVPPGVVWFRVVAYDASGIGFPGETVLLDRGPRPR